MMVTALRHFGTKVCHKEVLKMSFDKSRKSSVASLSGPAALQGLTQIRNLLMLVGGRYKSVP